MSAYRRMGVSAKHRDSPPSRRNADTAAIIVAGGKGLRFGGKIRKQYIRLNGRPILWWSVNAFQCSSKVGSIVLVVPAEDVPSVRKMADLWKFSKLQKVVAGGKTRQDSVREGLTALAPKIRWVAVHDAVRPLIRKETIEKALKAARHTGAAIVASLSKDTVKLANGDMCIHSTPPREKVWLAQTPQIFERKLLERAHASGRNSTVTDDAQLVERIGVKVKLVESPPDNLKITRPIDLLIARALIHGSPASTRRG